MSAMDTAAKPPVDFLSEGGMITCDYSMETVPAAETAAIIPEPVSAIPNPANTAIINELVAGFTNNAYSGRKEVMLGHLVNLSAEALIDFDQATLKSLFSLAMKLIKVSVSTVASNHGEIVNLCLALLCNLTVPEAHAQLLVDAHVINSALPGDATPSISISPELTLAVESFLEYDCQLLEQSLSSSSSSEGSSSTGNKQSTQAAVLTSEKWGMIDPWQHMSSILCNIARVEDGRRVILRQSTGYMSQLLRQIRSKNPIRRRGAVATLRSCLFDKDIHWWMVFEMNVVTHISLALVVATPFTLKEKEGMDPILFLSAEDPLKTWEPEIDILHMLLECLILLCQRRGIREELRKKKIYPICRNLDYAQEDEIASEKILEIVNFMMRDEDPNVPLDQGDPDNHIGRTQSKNTAYSGGMTMTGAMATTTTVITSSTTEGMNDDYINSVD